MICVMNCNRDCWAVAALPTESTWATRFPLAAPALDVPGRRASRPYSNSPTQAFRLERSSKYVFFLWLEICVVKGMNGFGLCGFHIFRIKESRRWIIRRKKSLIVPSLSRLSKFRKKSWAKKPTKTPKRKEKEEARWRDRGIDFFLFAALIAYAMHCRHLTLCRRHHRSY